MRDYQARAVAGVQAHWASGARAVCLVAPTGAGKTRMGEELAADAGSVVWVARRELIQQTARRLEDLDRPRHSHHCFLTPMLREVP